MDKNEDKMQKAEMGMHLTLNQESVAKDTEGKDGHHLPKFSLPLIHQRDNEPKGFSRGFEVMQSFRRSMSKLGKREEDEATNTGEDTPEPREEEKKEVLPMELVIPEKSTASEGDSFLPEDTPSLNIHEGGGQNSFSRGFRLMQSFRGSMSKFVKRGPVEATNTGEDTPEPREIDGQEVLATKLAIPEKCTANEKDHFLLEDPPSLNNHESSGQNTFSRGLKAKTWFKRVPSFIKEPSDKAPGASPSKKPFSLKILRPSDDGNHKNKETSYFPRKNEKEGKDPLSVIEINELIQQRQLLEAFEHVRVLETGLLAERGTKKHEENPKDFHLKAKDVHLLYESLSKAIQGIVEETLAPHCVNSEALKMLVALIEEEEKAHAGAANVISPTEPVTCLGLARNWRNFWREAVQESVKSRVFQVQIPPKESCSSWLSVHLGKLSEVTREDLLKIKFWVHKHYPEDFHVCDMYLKSFHEALSLHFQRILEDEKSLKPNHLYAVLDWVVDTYYSENCLGHPDLKPEIKPGGLNNLLPPEALDKLKEEFIRSIEQATKNYLGNILMLEKEKWDSEQQLGASQEPYHSSLAYDVQTFVGEHMKAAGRISKDLETAILEISIKEVTEFITRSGEVFLDWDKARTHPRCMSFMVTYLNNFQDLRMSFQSSFNASCEDLEKTQIDLMLRYKRYLLNKLKLKTQPMFKKILTRAWILRSRTSNPFIMKILLVVQDFSEQLSQLKEPMCKDFLHEVHKFVVKEYIRQILKPRRKMKQAKREEVSKIMIQEAQAVSCTMDYLGSTSDWLCAAIPNIASIIGEKQKDKIKDHLYKLSQAYPDIRKEHIFSILALRGLRRKKSKSIFRHLDSLSEEPEVGSDKTLFSEIELIYTTQCF